MELIEIICGLKEAINKRQHLTIALYLIQLLYHLKCDEDVIVKSCQTIKEAG